MFCGAVFALDAETPRENYLEHDPELRRELKRERRRVFGMLDGENRPAWRIWCHWSNGFLQSSEGSGLFKQPTMYLRARLHDLLAALRLEEIPRNEWRVTARRVIVIIEAFNSHQSAKPAETDGRPGSQRFSRPDSLGDPGQTAFR